MGSYVLISLNSLPFSNGSYSVPSSSVAKSNVNVEMVDMLARVGTVEAGDEQNGSPDMQPVLSRTIRGVICLP